MKSPSSIRREEERIFKYMQSSESKKIQQFQGIDFEDYSLSELEQLRVLAEQIMKDLLINETILELEVFLFDLEQAIDEIHSKPSFYREWKFS